MKKLVVLTGAGMSAESGISTFRDSGGLWEKYPVEEVATPEGFERNPSRVMDFYNQRRLQLLEVEPNEGHRILAQLESCFDVHVITQNVDNLHERAGSTQIIHLHGELTKVRSTVHPEIIRELNTDEYVVEWGDKAPDGYPWRPHIVWFGEAVPAIEEATEKVKNADLLLIIGTSLQVYPAAGLLHYAQPAIPVWAIDPNPLPVHKSVRQIQDTASQGLKRFRDEFCGDEEKTVGKNWEKDPFSKKNA